MTSSIKRPAAITYRQVSVEPVGRTSLRLPLLAPVNDLLGLSDETYMAYLFGRYSETFDLRGFLGGDGEKLRGEFTEAAKLAAQGRISQKIASHLQRVRFAGNGGASDVPDVAALAAWCLVELIRRMPLKLKRCPTCRRPWLDTPGGSRYCERRAPGQARDCRTLAKEKQLTSDSNYRAYRREYKRLDDAFRRKTISAQDLVAWRAENSAHSWAPFDMRKSNRPKEGNDV
jgi:Zn-finger nucleic acid-binding protein